MQYNAALLNARLDQFEAIGGPAPRLQIRTGEAPATTRDKAAGKLLVEMQLPTFWMLPASEGIKAMQGDWKAIADENGRAGHFRFYNPLGCFAQGTVGPNGELEVDDPDIEKGNRVRVVRFALQAARSSRAA